MKKYFALTLVIAALLIHLPLAHAERLWESGFEMNDLTAGHEWTVNGLLGTTISTTTVHSGKYSLEFNPVNQDSDIAYELKAAASAATTTCRIYVNFSALPAAATGTEIMELWRGNGTSMSAGIWINSAGQFYVTDNNLSQVGPSSTPITTGGWHYIELQVTGAVSNQKMQARLDGSVFASSTTMTGDTTQYLFVGTSGATGVGETVHFFADDVACNDTTGTNQNSWPGAGNEILYSPSGTGDINNWLQTAGAASSTTQWKNVSSTANFAGTVYNEARATGTRDLYAISPLTTLPANSTINSVQVGVRYGGSATTIPSFKVEAEQTAAGTIASSTAMAPNATTFKTNGNTTAVGNYPLTMDVDPTGVAWTNSTIGTMQIGQEITAGQATNFARIAATWAYVDYTPTSTPSIAKKRRRSIAINGN